MTPSTRSGRPVLRARRTIPGPPHDPVKARLLRLYRDLLRRYGPQHWWPGRSPYEIAVGAILTQHTAWTGAARAVAALRRRGLLTPERLIAIPESELAEVIRAAGTFRLKARRLRAFTEWLLARFGGRFHGLRRAPLGALRRELLAVPGLGPETVDAILLYAAHRPVFVADAYTRRVLGGQRLLSPTIGYEEARAFLEAHLPSDPALFNEFHALLVAVGKATRKVGGPEMAPHTPRRSVRPSKAVAHLDAGRAVTAAPSRAGSSRDAPRRPEPRVSGRARPSP